MSTAADSAPGSTAYGVGDRRALARLEAMWEPEARTSSSRVRHASSSASSTRRKWSRGKYVPQKKGSPSGVRKTVMGHPPCPVVAVTADMYAASMSGRSSRSTFTDTNRSLRAAATVSSPNDSCAMTWHQWQAAYPTLNSTGLLRRRASSNASGHQGHQSTGLSLCCSRYGDVEFARRFGIRPPSITGPRDRQCRDWSRAHGEPANHHGRTPSSVELATLIAARRRLRTVPAMTEPRGVTRDADTDPRHIFLTGKDVIARFGWGRTYGYAMLSSTGFPKAIGGRYRLDSLMGWEDRVL